MAGAELVGMSTYELFEFSCKSESKGVHTCEDMARDERQSADLKTEHGRCETCCSHFVGTVVLLLKHMRKRRCARECSDMEKGRRTGNGQRS